MKISNVPTSNAVLPLPLPVQSSRPAVAQTRPMDTFLGAANASTRMAQLNPAAAMPMLTGQNQVKADALFAPRAATAAATQWVPAPSFDDVLADKARFKVGQQGEGVKQLQRLLGVKDDGFFGNDTLVAVKAFQQSHGLTPPAGSEGEVGATTLKALVKEQGSGANPLPVDARFTSFKVDHVDSKGRSGMYVDQTAGFKALNGKDGKPQAVSYTAGFAVDTDGEGPHHGDSSADNSTSLTIGGRSANADVLPYVALPPGFAKQAGISLGDIVQVTAPNGRSAYAIYADNSDDRAARKLGEGSPALLKDLGYSGVTLDPNNGGLDNGVQFVAFPGSGKALGTTKNGFPSDAQVQAWGKQMADSLRAK